ncbi:MAG TPA: YceI family protein [Terriglobales bacterium]|nr:YceI family protein [Terriglobales bacterium]
MKYLVRSSLFLLTAVSIVATAAETAIDVEHSTIRIHVGKAGLFSAAGHEHWVDAPITDGSLQESPPQISFKVDATRMKVEDDPSLSAEKQAEVQRTMQTQVLESDKYAEITFRSTSIRATGGNTWEALGDLTLHGQTRPVTAKVEKQQGSYVGRCQLKQTDFGIRPVRVAGGTVKVKDQLDIEFSIAPAGTNAR